MYLSGEDLYKPFELIDLYSHYTSQLPQPPADGYQRPRDYSVSSRIDLKKGIAQVTPLGKSFITICLSDD